MVIKIIFDRYNGRLRTEGVSSVKNGPWGYSGNPFGDDECGKFYGRSLSVWSALLALQGFKYDGPAGRIGFAPVLTPENHKSFFTAAEGYGLYFQTLEGNSLKASIDLKEGQLRLTQVDLASPGGKSVQVMLDGKALEADSGAKDGTLRIALKKPLILKAGQKLDIQVAG